MNLNVIPLLLTSFLIPSMALAGTDSRIPIQMNGQGAGSQMTVACTLNSVEQRTCVLDTGAALSTLKEFPKTAYTRKGVVEDSGFSGQKTKCDVIEVPELKVGDLLKLNQTLLVCPSAPFDFIGLDVLKDDHLALVLDLRKPGESFVGYADYLPSVNVSTMRWLSEVNPLRKLILLSGIRLGETEVAQTFFDTGSDSIVDLEFTNAHPQTLRKFNKTEGQDVSGNPIEQYLILGPAITTANQTLSKPGMLTSTSLANVGLTDAKVDLLIGQNHANGALWAFDFVKTQWLVTHDSVACVERSQPFCRSGFKQITDGYGCKYSACK